MLPCDTLDLRGTRRPINFKRSTIELGKMTCGELLEILLDDGEPIENVPQSLAAEGHTVEGIEKLGDGGFIVFVRKL